MDYLLIDLSYLAWREFYGAARRDAHAVIPGVLAELTPLVERFRAQPIWVADRGPYHRASLYPAYKAPAPTKEPDPREVKEKAACRAAIDRLREEVLPERGQRVVHAPGFEADDLMAAAVAALPRGSRAVLVSRDADLWQLLRPDVCTFCLISNGGHTEGSFRAKYGLGPGDWAEVKALAGCPSDNVLGCPNVAEPTAVKYLRGDLAEIPKFRRTLIKAFYDCGGVEQNLKLTRLPYPGTPAVELE